MSKFFWIQFKMIVSQVYQLEYWNEGTSLHDRFLLSDLWSKRVSQWEKKPNVPSVACIDGKPLEKVENTTTTLLCALIALPNSERTTEVGMVTWYLFVQPRAKHSYITTLYVHVCSSLLPSVEQKIQKGHLGRCGSSQIRSQQIQSLGIVIISTLTLIETKINTRTSHNRFRA